MLTDKQKAWMYDNEPIVRVITGQEGDFPLFDIRPNRKNASGGYGIFERLSGVGSSIEEAVNNAMKLNSWSIEC